MKNKEFWKDTVYDILCGEGVVAVDKRTQKVKPCSCVDYCGQCLFGDTSGCVYNFRKWLEQEHIEPILSDEEKRYLESVLHPFRERVKFIVKNRENMHHEYLSMIVVTDYNDNEMITYMDFPYFERETMYIGMEPNMEYTLAELGLFVGESKATNDDSEKESE